MTTVVASDNPQFRHQVVTRLRSSSWTAEEVRGGAEALAMVEEGRCEILVLDRRLPDLDATELSWMVKARHPQIEALPGMIGASVAMRQVYTLSRLVTTRNTTVLIIGETGTGKELVARAIHQLSPRAKQPLVTVNCAAIPEALLESELFGYARGAFTGASQSRLGRIHSAHGGTLFLDEIGELPLSIQAKLLRFLQEGEVQRLGSPDIVRVDVRVIAATNADLTHLISENRFREDLYYRLTVFPIVVSPLRERPEDIPALSQHFLQLFCQESGVPLKRLTPAALRMLEKHAWPGNIRELRHTIERAFILSADQAEILPEHISLQVRLKKD